MHIHRILNEFDRHYGKPRKKTVISIVDSPHIYVEAVYGKNEHVMFRLYVRETPPDFVATTESRYELILYKDNIYINDYLMPDKEKQQHFFRSMHRFVPCKADFLAGSYVVDDLDRMLLKCAYGLNQKNLRFYAQCLMDLDFFHQGSRYENLPSDYREAVNQMEQCLAMEKYLAGVFEKYAGQTA